jgi:alanyl-tRNA synthetase
MLPMEQVDAVVIGAGVVGLAVGRALALAGREVLVLESENAIGTGTSSRNSEVIHAGIYYPAGSLKAPTAELNARIAQVLEQVKTLEKEVSALKGKLASSQGDELMAQAVDVKGLKVLAALLEGADAKTLRETLDKLKDKLKTAAIVLAAVDGDQVQIAAGVTADSIGKVKAGELVNFVAQQVGGKGGGKPDMAMAGGTDASKLGAALASVQGWVSERV